MKVEEPKAEETPVEHRTTTTPKQTISKPETTGEQVPQGDQSVVPSKTDAKSSRLAGILRQLKTETAPQPKAPTKPTPKRKQPNKDSTDAAPKKRQRKPNKKDPPVAEEPKAEEKPETMEKAEPAQQAETHKKTKDEEAAKEETKDQEAAKEETKDQEAAKEETKDQEAAKEETKDIVEPKKSNKRKAKGAQNGEAEDDVDKKAP